MSLSARRRVRCRRIVGIPSRNARHHCRHVAVPRPARCRRALQGTNMTRTSCIRMVPRAIAAGEADGALWIGATRSHIVHPAFRSSSCWRFCRRCSWRNVDVVGIGALDGGWHRTAVATMCAVEHGTHAHAAAVRIDGEGYRCVAPVRDERPAATSSLRGSRWIPPAGFIAPDPRLRRRVRTAGSAERGCGRRTSRRWPQR